MIWKHLGLQGLIRSCLASGLDLERFGPLGLDLELFQDLIWKDFVLSGLHGLIWKHLGFQGFDLEPFGFQGLIWSHLGLGGLIWNHLFGFAGLDLEPLGPPTWYHLGIISNPSRPSLPKK